MKVSELILILRKQTEDIPKEEREAIALQVLRYVCESEDKWSDIRNKEDLAGLLRSIIRPDSLKFCMRKSSSLFKVLKKDPILVNQIGRFCVSSNYKCSCKHNGYEHGYNTTGKCRHTECKCKGFNFPSLLG